ncbi:MAG: acetate--CoA ligase family protein [Candidatus Rokubacteria bacterium]|nr:acetate--CoA ligase family protein [Candidatus Rokubacteria bacterium]
MKSDLEAILRPRSVAIVGASNDETKRGFQAIRTLQEDRFPGAIYPVNPRGAEILGLQVYPRVSAIPGPVDLALIVTPALTVPEVLEDCGRKGVRGAVVIAVGFAETGREGRALEAEIVERAHRHGIRLVGPNTSGLFNLPHRLNLVGVRNVRPGRLALLCQSGNMALAVMVEASATSRLGFSAYVGVGNEADIRWDEYLRYFREDADTDLVLMYVEGFKDGRAFLRAARETVRRKPVLLLKGGRSEVGQRSASSHTGALAGSAVVAQAALRQAGVISVRRSDELLPAAEALTTLPPMRGNRVAVLADGGGHATLAADALSADGLEVPELSAETQQKLRSILHAAATVNNPVDVAGATDADPGLFAACAAHCLADPGVDALLIVGLFGGYRIRFAEALGPIEDATALRLGALVKETGLPLVVQSCYAGLKPEAHEILRQHGVPVHESLEIAAASISVLARRGADLERVEARGDFALPETPPETPAEVAEALRLGRDRLLEHEVRLLLRRHGVAVADFVLAPSADVAVAAAAAFGTPVAMKIVSPDILHKSEAGGVRLNVSGEDAIRAAFAGILAGARRWRPDAEIRGVLVSPMMPAGQEVIVGAVRDRQFGPVVMFGLGGVMVEALRDVAFRVAPLAEQDARDMLDEVRGSAVLGGFRGGPPVDRSSLVQLLLRVSDLVATCPHVGELDLNPVLAYPDGLSVVDARLVLTTRP